MPKMPQPERAAAAVAARVSRRSTIPPFIVMEVMQAAADRAATGADIVHMEVGQPGTPAPRAARDAVKRALDGDTLGYTMALGRAPPPAAAPPRPPFPGELWRPRGPRPGCDPHRLVGRVCAVLPGAVRRRCQGGAAVAGFPLLPPHPDRARPAAGADPHRSGLALD